jgi:hypothetical protein
MVLEVVWPNTIEDLSSFIENKIAEFPGWETYKYEENGDELYNQSANLATEIGMAAFNFAAGKLGLSALQASIASQNIYHTLFKDLK